MPARTGDGEDATSPHRDGLLLGARRRRRVRRRRPGGRGALVVSGERRHPGSRGDPSPDEGAALLAGALDDGTEAEFGGQESPAGLGGRQRGSWGRLGGSYGRTAAARGAAACPAGAMPLGGPTAFTNKKSGIGL